MSEQTFAASTTGSGEEDTQAALRPQAKTVDLDALLDDIDAVLATDAQAFVQGFVQKGGQ